MMVKLRFVVVSLVVLGCAGAALLPFISPLLENVAEYVLGETEEVDFIQDVVEAVVGKDPVEVVWVAADEVQRKYGLGTVTTRSAHADSLIGAFGTAEVVTTIRLMTTLTFVGGILFDMNSEDPDTTLDVIDDPPVPPDPDPDDDLIECLKGCLELPPGQARKCAEGCNGA